ncbi:hypothetical protein HR45_16365 [Shewanella mangrovi]|uniref:Lipoprotein n=1 Tax=Shewanella mangrovi TaxID=1515746 RepID=A0A094JVE0_9GAMM|nr:YajG family lipoprotein [Shewanella mangrovi]KFZ36396.1 hypothetical protein HR45_16365 [Shewanella mangrovi]
MRLLFALLTITALLTGCAANSPKTLVLSPEIPPATAQTSSLISLALKSKDMRSISYVVRFMDDDKVERLVNPAESPRITLERLFNQALANAGYQIDPASSRDFEIVVDQVVTDVDESMLGFEANTHLMMTVNASNQNRTFTKRYSATSRLKGPFKADFASLELDINKLITQLSGQIVNDPELNQFLQQ